MFLPKMTNGCYLSSIDPGNEDELQSFQRRMRDYHLNPQYHREWIRGYDSGWQAGTHDPQIKTCEYISPGSRLLEVGCSQGSSLREIKTRVENVEYIGLDLNPALWPGKQGFVAATAQEIPFRSASFDVVLSLFVMEHLVFPVRFIEEAWRVLRPGGRFLVVAPDFTSCIMSSERIGLSYGSGRQKLAQGKVVDALLTAYDTRVRLYFRGLRRRKDLMHGKFSFPIYTRPRCLHLPGFVSDCDAVYPVCPEEIVNFLRMQSDYGQGEIFYHSPSIFGLFVMKL